MAIDQSQIKQTRVLLISFSIFLVVLVGTIIWLATSHARNSGKPLEANDVAATSTATTLVSVKDQAAGGSVLVDAVNTAETDGLWAAVAEMDGANVLHVLGAARVLAAKVPFEIPLLRDTLPNASYAVVLYRDDGDSAFDPRKDSVYVDFDSGERVVAPFRTAAPL